LERIAEKRFPGIHGKISGRRPELSGADASDCLFRTADCVGDSLLIKILP
jgi:hypothetical protein